MNTLESKAKCLILLAVKQAGTYDPDVALTFVEEQMNDREFTKASMFLRWLMLHKKTVGNNNFDSVFNEFERSTEAKKSN
jgi:hypothetical protein